MSDEREPGRADLLSDERLRLRVELSDLRRRLIAEQEERARLALELHRTKHRLEGSGAPASSPESSPNAQDLLAAARDAGVLLRACGAELLELTESSAAALRAGREANARLMARVAAQAQALHSLAISTSWRITAPLRALKGGGGLQPVSPEIDADETHPAVPSSPDAAGFEMQARRLETILAEIEAALLRDRETAAREAEELRLELYVTTSDLHRAADYNDRLLAQLQAERDGLPRG